MLEHIVGAQRRSTPPFQPTEVIRDVKSRWRMKLAARGAVRSVAVAVAVFSSPPTRSNGHASVPRPSSPPVCCSRPQFSARSFTSLFVR